MMFEGYINGMLDEWEEVIGWESRGFTRKNMYKAIKRLVCEDLVKSIHTGCREQADERFKQDIMIIEASTMTKDGKWSIKYLLMTYKRRSDHCDFCKSYFRWVIDEEEMVKEHKKENWNSCLDSFWSIPKSFFEIRQLMKEAISNSVSFEEHIDTLKLKEILAE